MKVSQILEFKVLKVIFSLALGVGGLVFSVLSEWIFAAFELSSYAAFEPLC